MRYDVKEIAKLCKERVNDDFDVMIIITGDTGTGKSNLALNIGLEYQKICGDDKFILNDNLAFKRDEVIEFVNNHNNKEVLIIDEAVNVAFNRDFLDKDQKNLMKVLDIMRSRNLVTLWNLPNFKSIDIHARNRCKIWIYVESRGKAHVFIAPKNPAKADKWDLSLIQKYWVYKQYEKMPSYKGVLSFEATPKDIEKEYNILKDKARDEIEKEELKKENKNCIICNSTHFRYLVRNDVQQCRSCGYERKPFWKTEGAGESNH